MKTNGYFLITLIVALGLFVSSCSDEDRNLKSIQIEPGYLKTYLNSPSRQFSAIGHYSDGDKEDLTNESTWSSSTLQASAGVVSFNRDGSHTISASYGGDSTSGSITGNAMVDVVGDLLSISIKFDPYTTGILRLVSAGVYDATSDSSITARFSAIGRYSDDSTLDITSAATWSYDSSDDRLDPTGDANGQVYLNKIGKFQIKVSAPAPNSTAIIWDRIVVNITAP